MLYIVYFIFFFFKQKTAYEMRISDWSSDVCSSDLLVGDLLVARLVLDHIGLVAHRESVHAPAERLHGDGETGAGVAAKHRPDGDAGDRHHLDRKSTRLNSSH